jgi:hypothetical protein
VIASSTDGVFNASLIRVYAKPLAGGNTLYWDTAIPLDVPTVSLTFTVAGADLGSASIATVADTFGLYEPTGAIAGRVAGVSTLGSGSYDIFVAFYYSGTVTEISHSPTLGCIPEADGGLADLYTLLYYSAPPVYQFGHLRAIPFEGRRPLRQVFCAIAQGNYRWNPLATTSEDIDYSFRTAAGAPASGELGLDNESPSLATEIRFHSQDRDGAVASDIVEQIAEGGEVRLDTSASGEVWASFSVISAAVLSAGVYSLQVLFLEGFGTFIASNLIVLSIGKRLVRPYDVVRGSPGRWVPEVAAAGGGSPPGESVVGLGKILVLDGQVLTFDDHVLYLE